MAPMMQRGQDELSQATPLTSGKKRMQGGGRRGEEASFQPALEYSGWFLGLRYLWQSQRPW